MKYTGLCQNDFHIQGYSLYVYSLCKMFLGARIIFLRAGIAHVLCVWTYLVMEHIF